MYDVLHAFRQRLGNTIEIEGGATLIVCIVFYTNSGDGLLGNIIEIKGGAKLGGAKLGGAKLIVCIDFYILRQRLDTGGVSNVIELKRGAKLIVYITFCKHSGDVWVA